MDPVGEVATKTPRAVGGRGAVRTVALSSTSPMVRAACAATVCADGESRKQT